MSWDLGINMKLLIVLLLKYFQCSIWEFVFWWRTTNIFDKCVGYQEGPGHPQTVWSKRHPTLATRIPQIVQETSHWRILHWTMIVERTLHCWSFLIGNLNLASRNVYIFWRWTRLVRIDDWPTYPRHDCLKNRQMLMFYI